MSGKDSNTRFSYTEISSLIIKSDRSTVPRRDKETDSDFAESLWGKISTKEMGKKAARGKAPLAASGTQSAGGAKHQKQVPGIRQRTAAQAGRGGNRNAALQEELFYGLAYRPVTHETKLAYSHLLAALSSQMQLDQAEQVIRGATDEAISILKDPGTSDDTKRERLQDTLGTGITLDQFGHMVSLALRLTDYGIKREDEHRNALQQHESSVAVVFGDDDNEDGGQAAGNRAAGDANAGAFDDGDDDDNNEQEEDDEDEDGVAVIIEDEDQNEGPTGSTTHPGERALNLEELEFPNLGHTMTNKHWRLPEGATRRTHKDYEEITVPIPTPKSGQQQFGPGEVKAQLVPVDSLPEWMRPAFGPIRSLNRVQSAVAKTVLESDGNVLVCAPTGAGKTTIALLAMLREVGKFGAQSVRLVYIAPMKALVQEMAATFARALAPFEMRVAELTGDQHMTYEQLARDAPRHHHPRKVGHYHEKGQRAALPPAHRLGRRRRGAPAA